MKSRTSFSKLTPFRKDLSRYAPVWALYVIGLLLYILAMGMGVDGDYFAYRQMKGMTGAFGIINLIYAGVCAAVLFGDLFNTKLCYSIHALPQRREGWLLSHLCAGFAFSLVPNILLTLFFMLRLQEYWYLALCWLLASQLQFLFFFALGVFCVMLTGKRFAMLAVYGVCNFVAMLIYAVVEMLYVPLLEGVYTQFNHFSPFSPTVRLMQFEYFLFDRKTIEAGLNQFGKPNTRIYYEFLGLGDGWWYMAFLGVLGVGFLVGAWWLYRKRHLECAGDFLAFSKLKPLASLVITVCVGLGLVLLGKMFHEDGYLIWLVIGLIVGHFGGLMLLERRLKVFRKKTFLGLAILVMVVAISVACIGMDWLGIEDWTPKADRVKSVTVSNGSPSQNYYGADYMIVTIDDPGAIEEIIRAHEDILGRLNVKAETKHRVHLEYKLKSGRTVSRTYYAPASGESYEIITRYLYTADSVLGYWDAIKMADQLEYMYMFDTQISKEHYVMVLTALELDYEAGFVQHQEAYNCDYMVEYNYRDDEGKNHYRVLGFNENAPHLMALMKDAYFCLGFEDPETFLPMLLDMEFQGNSIHEDQWVELLKAMLVDAKNGTLLMGKAYGDDCLYYEWEDAYGDHFGRGFTVTPEAENTWHWLIDHGYKQPQ